MTNLLTTLRRVDCDRPAAREIAADRWAVEPGDSTHYEVLLAENFGGYTAALAYVGTSPDQGLLVVHYSAWHSKEIPFGQPSGYTLEVLRYFAGLAHGDDDGEPPGLAERRKPHEL